MPGRGPRTSFASLCLRCSIVARRKSSPSRCLPSSAKVPPSGPGWIHEIKHDGFRIIARRDGAGVRLFARRGHDLAARFPLAAAAIAALPAHSFLIDGEAIVTDDDGLAVFDLVRRQRNGGAAVLRAFDLIELARRTPAWGGYAYATEPCLLD
jgi:bifunctional non-homologous end joining protein LigD